MTKPYIYIYLFFENETFLLQNYISCIYVLCASTNITLLTGFMIKLITLIQLFESVNYILFLGGKI